MKIVPVPLATQMEVGEAPPSSFTFKHSEQILPGSLRS